MKNLKIVVLILLAAGLNSGCATYWQMKRVESDQMVMQGQLLDLKARQAALEEVVELLKNDAGRLDEAARRNKVDALTQIESLEQQMRSLQARLNDLNERLSRLNQKFDARPAGADSTQQGSASGAAFFQEASLDFSRGHYPLAIEGFREYIRRFPEGEMAASAQYYIGEAYYAGSDYPAAVEAYEAVVNGYPAGEKTAAALLKIAYCYLAQGDDNGGRAYLERVIREYPASAEAALAQARLQGR